MQNGQRFVPKYVIWIFCIAGTSAAATVFTFIYLFHSLPVGEPRDFADFAVYFSGTWGTILLSLSLVFLGLSISYQHRSAYLQSKQITTAVKIELNLFKLRELAEGISKYKSELISLADKQRLIIFPTSKSTERVPQAGSDVCQLSYDEFLFRPILIIDKKEQALKKEEQTIKVIYDLNDDQMERLLRYIETYTDLFTCISSYVGFGGNSAIYLPEIKKAIDFCISFDYLLHINTTKHENSKPANHHKLIKEMNSLLVSAKFLDENFEEYNKQHRELLKSMGSMYHINYDDLKM